MAAVNQQINLTLPVSEGSKLWLSISDLPNARDVRLAGRIPTNCELVRNVTSREFDAFYSLLGTRFGPEELEPRSVFELEVSTGLCKCLIVKNPLAKAGEIAEPISVAYGSMHTVNGEDSLAVRFILTHPDFSATGSTELAGRTLINVCRAESSDADRELKHLLAEAVKTSEPLLNRAKIVPGGPPMKRIFTPDNQEIFYQLPPLAWNSDGSFPQPGAREHLMITGDQSVETRKLVGILESLWSSWYIRPATQFEGDRAYKSHCDTVEQILDKQIVSPLRRYETLILLSKRERGQLQISSYDE